MYDTMQRLYYFYICSMTSTPTSKIVQAVEDTDGIGITIAYYNCIHPVASLNLWLWTLLFSFQRRT